MPQVHLPSGASALDFDPETLPWLDRVYAEIDRYVRDLGERAPASYDLREALIRWVRDGYVIRPSLIEHDLIDQVLADIDQFDRIRDTSHLMMAIEGFGVHQAREFPEEAFEQHHARLMDFHDISEAAQQLALHPQIVEFLGHVFREPVVAMQSLTFIHGTEQPTHQDFPYVAAQILSHLAATWIALEDAHPDAGPLFYNVGSHTVRKFDWGNGLTLTGASTFHEGHFAEYLVSECAGRGYERATFCPRKGDVLFWHAGLVHGGSPVVNPELTRRSFVTHYSTERGYPIDRRVPDREPWKIALNGASFYADQRNPDVVLPPGAPEQPAPPVPPAPPIPEQPAPSIPEPLGRRRRWRRGT